MKHLENVNAISANQNFSLQGSREGETAGTEQKDGAGEATREEKPAGLCPRDLSRCAVEELAHSSFFSLSLSL